MPVSMNNPLYDPEQLEYRGPKLDPEYDDIPDTTLYVAVTSDGVRHELDGGDELAQFIEWCEDEELTYTIQD